MSGTLPVNGDETTSASASPVVPAAVKAVNLGAPELPPPQGRRAARRRRPHRPRGRWPVRAAATTMGLGTIVATLTIVYLAGHPMNGDYRPRWIAGTAGAWLLLIIVASMVIRPSSQPFAWISDIVALIAVACAVGLAPTLVLSPPSQVLLLQIGLVLIFSLSPGLLYFQFVRARGPALWDDFVVTLSRLGVKDYGPLPQPVDVKKNIYLKKFEATYGRFPTDQTRGRALFPVLCVTVLTSIGWAAVLQPQGFTGWKLFGSAVPHLPIMSYQALRFGFVGVSFYMSEMLVRRYFQNDLKSDAYMTCLLRLFTTTFLVAVLSVATTHWPQSVMNGVAFGIGVFPQIAVDVVRTKLLRPLRSSLKGFDSQYGLGMLDGMNVWYESRLLEEGVEDLQNLKTANWIDLILQTRIPPGRIVDWVDQATLIVHVIPPPKTNDGGPTKMDLLREYGIRTATDLEAAVYGKVSGGPHGLKDPDLGRLLNLRWSGSGWVDDGRPDILPTVLRTLAMEPNLRNARCWKRQIEPRITVLLPDESAETPGDDPIRSA